MSSEFDAKKALAQMDFSNRGSLLRCALHLEGMTFRDVLDL